MQTKKILIVNLDPEIGRPIPIQHVDLGDGCGNVRVTLRYSNLLPDGAIRTEILEHYFTKSS